MPTATYCSSDSPNTGQNIGNEARRVACVVAGAKPSPSTVCRLTRDKMAVIQTTHCCSNSSPSSPSATVSRICAVRAVVLPSSTHSPTPASTYAAVPPARTSGSPTMSRMLRRTMRNPPSRISPMVNGRSGMSAVRDASRTAGRGGPDFGAGTAQV